MDNNYAKLDEAEEAAATSTGGCSSREARNLAEKQRRDKLNASIHELASMVPHVAESTRRHDKTAVLRFTAHGLRLRHVFGKAAAKRRSVHESMSTDSTQFADTLMQILDSFLIAVTCHGQIVLISPSVEQLLGHCQSDLYGQNLLHITHPEDQLLLRQQLIPHELDTLFQLAQEQQEQQQHEEEADAHMQQQQQQRQLAQQAFIDSRLREDRRCFTLRLARAGTRAESARSYEIVKIDGCFRRSDYTRSTIGTYPLVSQLLRRARGGGSSSGGIPNVGNTQLPQHDAMAQAALHGISGNDIVLCGMARIVRPAPSATQHMLESNQLEYKTRHLIDGRIVDCDQRIGIVAGYMKDEVRNLSPFSFMHQDDVSWVIVALRQMYDCNSDYGESCYRLLARNGNFIYLQTKGFFEIDKNTNKVHSFVCVNTLLDEDVGRRKIQEMKNKFSVIIKTKIPCSSMLDVPASLNSQQLKKMVLCLIENLDKSQELQAGNMRDAANERMAHCSKSPALVLVPPEEASVKNSISQSVNLVNVTAAKNLLHSSNVQQLQQQQQQQQSEQESSKESQQQSTKQCGPQSLQHYLLESQQHSLQQIIQQNVLQSAQQSLKQSPKQIPQQNVLQSAQHRLQENSKQSLQQITQESPQQSPQHYRQQTPQLKQSPHISHESSLQSPQQSPQYYLQHSPQHDVISLQQSVRNLAQQSTQHVPQHSPQHTVQHTVVQALQHSTLTTLQHSPPQRPFSASPHNSNSSDNNIAEYLTLSSPSQPPVTATITTQTTTPQQRPSVLKVGAKKTQHTAATQTAIVVDNIINNNNNNNHSSNNIITKITTPPTSTETSPSVNASKQRLPSKISVLKRLHETSTTNSSNETNSMNTKSAAKRAAKDIVDVAAAATVTLLPAALSPPHTPSEVQSIITTSLQNLDESLHIIDSATMRLCDQQALYKPLPHAFNQKLHKGKVERQLLVNMKNEYHGQQKQQLKQQPQKQLLTAATASLHLSRLATQTTTTSAAATTATAAVATSPTYATATSALINHNHTHNHHHHHHHNHHHNGNNLKVGTLTITQCKPR